MDSKKTIIHGTDFSDNAVRAGRVAAAIASRLNDRLLVLHSAEIGLRESFPFTSEMALAKFESAKKEQLKKEAAVLKSKKLTIKTKLLEGAADEAIVNEASAKSTRMVVVASLGRREQDRWRLGSVSERVAEFSPVPTLVVRQDEALVAWAQRKKPLKVLFAHDFSTSADAALAYLKELRHIGPLEIIVALVYCPASEMARLGISGRLPSDANHAEIQAVLERDLTGRITAIPGGNEMRIRVSPGSERFEFHLVQIAREEQADLIVTGTQQRHGLARFWHGSTSRGLLHHASMSVLVVPTKATTVEAAIPQIRRVLVTTDFSDLGNRAIPHACSLVNGGGTVHLLHVVPPGESGRGEPPGAGKKPRKVDDDRPTKRCLKQLRTLVPAEAKTLGVSVEVEVCEHPIAAEAICQAAERLGADVICLATHGRTGLASVILGSVATAVLAGSNRPLHLVRAPEG